MDESLAPQDLTHHLLAAPSLPVRSLLMRHPATEFLDLLSAAGPGQTTVNPAAAEASADFVSALLMAEASAVFALALPMNLYGAVSWAFRVALLLTMLCDAVFCVFCDFCVALLTMDFFAFCVALLAMDSCAFCVALLAMASCAADSSGDGLLCSLWRWTLCFLRASSGDGLLTPPPLTMDSDAAASAALKDPCAAIQQQSVKTCTRWDCYNGA